MATSVFPLSPWPLSVPLLHLQALRPLRRSLRAEIASLLLRWVVSNPEASRFHMQSAISAPSKSSSLREWDAAVNLVL